MEVKCPICHAINWDAQPRGKHNVFCSMCDTTFVVDNRTPGTATVTRKAARRRKRKVTTLTRKKKGK